VRCGPVVRYRFAVQRRAHGARKTRQQYCDDTRGPMFRAASNRYVYPRSLLVQSLPRAIVLVRFGVFASAEVAEALDQIVRGRLALMFAVLPVFHRGREREYKSSTSNHNSII
jgi:hypothetical protein